MMKQKKRIGIFFCCNKNRFFASAARIEFLFQNPNSAKNERTYLISKQSDDSGVEEKRRMGAFGSFRDLTWNTRKLF